MDYGEYATSQSSVNAVATTLATSTVSSETDLTESVLKEVTKLPQLDLYSERKKVMEIVQEQCEAELGNFVSSLCQKIFYFVWIMSWEGWLSEVSNRVA